MTSGPDEISAETIARIAAQLGAPSPRSPKPKYPFDLGVEQIVIGETTHYRVHLVQKGRRYQHQNHTAGPEFDALIAKAEELGFKVIRS